MSNKIVLTDGDGNSTVIEAGKITITNDQSGNGFRFTPAGITAIFDFSDMGILGYTHDVGPTVDPRFYATIPIMEGSFPESV